MATAGNGTGTQLLSDAELKRAIGSLVRVSAHDAKPNEKGERLILHRGDGNAELFSQVQADGKLIKQQLVLFGDVILWQHGVPVRTGAEGGGVTAAPGFAGADLDGKLDRDRLGRLRVAVDGYRGSDHYIAHLVRVVHLIHSHALGSAPLVTRAAAEVSGRYRKPAKAKRSVPRAALLAAVGALAVFLLLLLRRA